MSGRLIHIIGSSRWRGKERYALDICKEFSDRGWRVTAYTRDAKAVDTFFEKAGIDLRHAPMHGAFDFTTIGILKEDFKAEERGAVVHTHRYRDAMSAIVARKLARRPDIRIVNTRHKVKKGKNSLLFRWIYRNVDAHIFVSEIAKKRFLSAWKSSKCPADEAKMFVVLNSIAIPQGEMVEEPEKGPRIGLFHGPLIPGKGVETLIDAITRLKGQRTRILIIGGGDPDYVDRLRRRAMTRGVMEMIDWKKHVDDPHEIIDKCHFGIQPSLMPEAFCLPNIEYMIHGRPVVCSDSGAQGEYISHGNEGLLVHPADASALGDALLLMAQNDDLRKKMGRNAYRKFKDKLNWNIFSDKIANIYKA